MDLILIFVLVLCVLAYPIVLLIRLLQLACKALKVYIKNNE